MEKNTWLKERYSKLLSTFGDKTFTFNQAKELLSENFGDNENMVFRVLSDLQKLKWLKAESDPNDKRKKIYNLILKFSEKGKKRKLGRAEMEALMKKAANTIRNRVSYDFILTLLFLKRISDKWKFEFKNAKEELIKEGLDESIAEKEAKRSEYHDFDFEENVLWDNIKKDISKLPENLSKALKVLADKNPELSPLVLNSDFIQFTRNDENLEILRQLVELFSSVDLSNVSPDILGDAYEWLLRYFAPQKAKEGEIYTPREVIRLLVELTDPKLNESVYDPAVGSAGMLIGAFNYCEEKYGKGETLRNLFLYGQEVNPKTYALGLMNAKIHDIKEIVLEQGDTLRHPKFIEEGDVKKFNVVIANPPWNQDGYGEETMREVEYKHRFSFGFVPKQSADWLWIQHMIYSADDSNGRVGLVIDNGALFRGRKEKVIRRKVLEKDLIDTVILLPEKLFYNTSAPGVIIIFNKNKEEKRRGKVLIINASQEFEKHESVRRLNQLKQKNINKIVQVYREYKEVEGFSRIVSLDEIKENEYNLNVTLYVYPEEEEEEIDVRKEWSDIKEINKEIELQEKKIEEYLRWIYEW